MNDSFNDGVPLTLDTEIIKTIENDISPLNIPSVLWGDELQKLINCGESEARRLIKEYLNPHRLTL